MTHYPPWQIPVTSAYLKDEHLPISSKWSSIWPTLPIIPSIIVLVDACLVSYKRTAVTLHAFTRAGGEPERPVGGAIDKKRGSWQKTATSKKAARGKVNGIGKVKNAKAAVEDIDEVAETSAESEESDDEGIFVSDKENDEADDSHSDPPKKRIKRTRRERVSEPLRSNPTLEEHLQPARSARSRHSAPLESTVSIWADEIEDEEDHHDE